MDLSIKNATLEEITTICGRIAEPSFNEVIEGEIHLEPYQESNITKAQLTEKANQLGAKQNGRSRLIQILKDFDYAKNYQELKDEDIPVAYKKISDAIEEAA